MMAKCIGVINKQIDFHDELIPIKPNKGIGYFSCDNIRFQMINEEHLVQGMSILQKGFKMFTGKVFIKDCIPIWKFPEFL